MDTTTTSSNNVTQLSAIERALAAAKARRAARESSEESVPPTVAATPRPGGLHASVAVVTEDSETVVSQRGAARAARERDRAEAAERRRVECETRRAAKLAQTVEKSSRPTHMKKVESARARLPGLGVVASRIFDEAATVLDSAQLEALAAHLQFHNRRAATESAPAKPLPVGTEVTITGGEPRFIGQVGKVTKSKKLRSYVRVEGRAREVYVFTAHLQPVEG